MLRTFGGLVLEDGGRPIAGAAAQRGRLAILAALGLAGDRGLSRDRLHALFWPDADVERARGALNQALYSLRRDAGEQDLTLGTTELRLNPAAVQADVRDFEQALAAGELERAVDLYRGAFLDGIHLHAAEEFERWLERERQRLAEAYQSALERLARADEARGDHSAAVRHWRRLAAADPLSATAAASLMSALAAAGDSAAALRHAVAYETLVRAELNAAPDPEVITIAERIRQRTENAAAARSGRFGAVAEAPSVVPALPPVDAGAAGFPAQRGDRRRRWVWFAAAGTVGTLALGFALGRVLSPPRTAPGLVVLPFKYSGHASQRYVAPGLAQLLRRGIMSTAGIRVIEPPTDTAPQGGATGPAAASEGPTSPSHLLSGYIVEQAGRVRVSLALTAVASPASPLFATDVEGTASELFDLADRLAGQLVAALRPGMSPTITRAAANTTASLPAFRAFMEGEQYFLERRYLAAMESFEAATRADSSFAMAYYRWSQAADYEGRSELAPDLAERAAHHSTRLPIRERLLLQGHAAFLLGQADRSERLLRELVREFPEEIDGTRQLGELLFHLNPFHGRSLAEARDPFAVVTAARPDDYDAWTHAGRIVAAQQTRTNGHASAAVPRELESMPEARPWWGDFTSGPEDLARVARKFAERADNSVYAQAQRTAVYFGRLDRAEEVARILAHRSRPRSVRALAWMTIAELDLARGRAFAAESALAEADRFDPRRTLERRALLAAVLPGPPRVDELHRMASALSRAPSATARDTQPDLEVQDRVVVEAPAYLGGLIAARLLDSAAAWSAALRLERGGESQRGKSLAPWLAPSVRALFLAERGHLAAALVELERSTDEAGLAVLLSPFGPQAWQRYLRARLLAALGRLDEALTWYATVSENSTFDLIFLGPALLAQGAILERRGDRDSARRCYERLTALWRDADVSFEPMLREARAALARLR
jgi:DNA-binding SARP family transcriptional activator/TolB-like protein